LNPKLLTFYSPRIAMENFARAGSIWQDRNQPNVFLRHLSWFGINQHLSSDHSPAAC
jgi:hypothetical protein